MLILASTSDKLQVLTGSAGNINVHVSWMDNVSGAVGPGRTNTGIAIAGTTDIVAPPASGVYRNIKTVHIRNAGGAANDVIVRHTDGTVIVELYRITLVSGATLSYIDEVGFFVSTFTGETVFSTGDAKLTFKSAADPGWILMNDGTFGDSLSAASNRANADCEALFTMFYNGTTDAWAPMLSNTGVGITRGSFTNAAAAWAAHARMTLTRQLGRTIAISGSGASLTARPLGSYVGEENHVLTVPELATHNHGITDPSHAHAVADPGHLHGNIPLVNPNYGINNAQSGQDPNTNYVYPTQAATGTDVRGTGIGIYGNVTGISVNAMGSSAGHNTMQPTSFWNVMIKL